MDHGAFDWKIIEYSHRPGWHYVADGDLEGEMRLILPRILSTLQVVLITLKARNDWNNSSVP